MNGMDIRNRFQKILIPATSKSVLSPFVIFTTFVISAVLHLGSGFYVGTQSTLMRAFISGSAMLPAFLLIAVIQAIPMRSEFNRSIVIVTSYVAGSASRGFLVAVQLKTYNGNEDWKFRVPASAFILSLTILMLTLGVETYRKRRDFIADLERENAELQAALKELEVISASEFTKGTSQLIAGISTELSNGDLHPAHQQIETIEKIIQEQIRPLSAKLAQEMSVRIPAKFSVKKQKFIQAWTSQNLFAHLPSWWAAIPAGLAPLPLVVFFAGWFHGLLTFTTVFLVFSLSQIIVKRIFSKRLQNLKSPMREIILLFIFEIEGAITALATWFGLRNTSNSHITILPAFIGLPMYLLILVVSSTFFAESRARAANLVDVRASLRWTIARVELLSWYYRGEMTRLLHGPIQNALLATQVRLQKDSSGDGIRYLIPQLRERLNTWQEDQLGRAEGQRNIHSELLSLQGLWHGLASIQISLPDNVLKLFSRDQPGTGIATDICTELVSNAVRHGSSTDIEITFAQQEHGVRIQFNDNGSEIPEFTRSGVGSRILDDCTVEWWRERVGSRNELSALIPVA